MLKELEPTTGRIIINGKDLKKIKHRKIHLLRRDIGVVFQDFRLLKDRSVYDNVAFAQRVVEVPNRDNPQKSTSDAVHGGTGREI